MISLRCLRKARREFEGQSAPQLTSYHQHARNRSMKHSFYDVKAKSKVEAKVTEKVTYGKKGNERYAFKAKTADGRNLTAFVSKDKWDAAKI